jgi:hypothetical protein
MRNQPTNQAMLETADRVVTWFEASYISEEQVEEITAAVPQEAVAEESGEPGDTIGSIPVGELP